MLCLNVLKIINLQSFSSLSFYSLTLSFFLLFFPLISFFLFFPLYDVVIVLP